MCEVACHNMVAIKYHVGDDHVTAHEGIRARGGHGGNVLVVSENVLITQYTIIMAQILEDVKILVAAVYTGIEHLGEF